MELRDLYDENKIPTWRTFVKGEQVPEGYYYLIVKIFIQNDKNEFLIQKRVERKGGRWSITGGHPKAGETSLEGIITETEEELGINVRNEKLELFKTVKHNDQFFDLYFLKKDIDIKDINIQEEEVENVKWATLEEIEDMHKNEKFHEGDYILFEKCLEYLKNK